MQRYYHKGAFFQDDADDAFASRNIRGDAGDDVLDRDYAAARTGEDKINFESLPEVMRVRKWGKVGRTKWTHLSNEDTSRPNDPYYRMRNQAGGDARGGHSGSKRRRDAR